MDLVSGRSDDPAQTVSNGSLFSSITSVGISGGTQETLKDKIFQL